MRLGVERSTLEENLWQIGSSYQKVRNVVTEPTGWWLRTVGNRQMWSMFVAGARIREILVIRGVSSDKSPEVLYRRGDKVHTWNARLWEQPRMRSVSNRWSWKQYQKSFRRACKEAAKLAFEERLDFVRLECLFEKGDSPSPEDAKLGILHDVKEDLVVVIYRTEPTERLP